MNAKRSAKFLSLLLVLSTLVTLIASCNDKDDDKDKKDPAGTTQTGSDPDKDPSGYLAEQLYGSNDYDGKEFRILAPGATQHWYGFISDTANEVWFETSSSDPLERSIYERNQSTEKLLNIKIKHVTTDQEIEDLVSTGVNAATDDYDAVLTGFGSSMNMARNGYLLNFNDLESFDATHTWWDTKFLQDIAIFNTDIYTIAGAINIFDDIATSTILFNKNLLEKYSLETPYQAVHDGTWTVEELMSRARATTVDTSGDSRNNENDDWGMGTYGTVVLMGIQGFGVKIATTNAEGVPELTIDSEENISMALYWWENVSASRCLYNQGTNGTTSYEDMFLNGQIAFAFTNLTHPFGLRDMDDEYGILPMAKYNAEQPEYYSSSNPAFFTTYIIPKNSQNPEMVAVCLEVMSAYSVNTLDYSLHDILFETKLARDEDSREILKILQASIPFEWGYVGGWTLDISNAFALPQRGVFDLASRLEAVRESAQEALDEMIADFDDISTR